MMQRTLTATRLRIQMQACCLEVIPLLRRCNRAIKCQTHRYLAEGHHFRRVTSRVCHSRMLPVPRFTLAFKLTRQMNKSRISSINQGSKRFHASRITSTTPNKWMTSSQSWKNTPKTTRLLLKWRWTKPQHSQCNSMTLQSRVLRQWNRSHSSLLQFFSQLRKLRLWSRI